ncbi:polysaccharide deacetylase family protein [Bacillus aerius]|uniref:polysaccharide deacetylase family protein n=1 Tax=Bacillus aerius TaxID=293388 RepID=UPI002814E794|nr:polysaccharide deacetylase family protein [Bacillus aerius]WMT30489.1 polysaccharide deacetylase family protein [Bacillus aerius]
MKRLHILLCILVLCVFVPDNIEARTLKRIDLEKTGRAFWDMREERKKIALTFDDGPHPVYTNQILDVLREHEVNASFFVIGSRIHAYPLLAGRIVSEGNELGNHTMNHTYFDLLSSKEIKQELKESAAHIASLQPGGPLLFRPPGGRLTMKSFRILSKQGYDVVMWSFTQDPKDWSRPGAHKIASHIMENIQGGDIILLHDGGGNRKQTVEALKQVVPELKKRGYEFVKVSELLHHDRDYLPVQLQ